MVFNFSDLRRDQHRFGIGARLLTAFWVVVGLAVAASIAGWYSYGRLAKEFSGISETEIPRLVFATRLSRAGADVNAIMPELINSDSRVRYGAARTEYSSRLMVLDEILEEMRNSAIDTEAVSPLVQSIRSNLEVLDIAAGKRFTLIEEMRDRLEDLRWLQSDVIDETQPLVDDARFNLQAELGGAGRTDVINQELRKNEALLSLVAQANLAIGLISRVSEQSRSEDLPEAIAFLGDVTDQLQASNLVLKDWPDAITVQQLSAQIVSAADIRSGFPNLKRNELREQNTVRQRAEENRALVEQLGERIRLMAEAVEDEARTSMRTARNTISLGQSVLLSIAIAAILVAISVGHFYVGRTLLPRIEFLARAAGNISEGRSASRIPDDGSDELSDLARALNLFRDTRDELIQSAKLAALGQMAAGIGHELNQPLAAIRSQTHNAERYISRKEPEKALQNLNKIEQATARMSEQIGHLRRFARLPERTIGPVDPMIAIDEAIALLAHRFEDEQVCVFVDRGSRDVCNVLAEAVRLEQVLVNLLANALDAVAGRDKREIEIAVKPSDKTVQILVRDTGAGIPHDDVLSVFDPFFTTKSASSGLGLGLSISYNIVRDFNGTIEVFETSDAGTCFLLSLQRRDA